MQIKNIVCQIDLLRETPIYFTDDKEFTSVTYLKPSSDKKQGLYLPDYDSLIIFEYCQKEIPDGYQRIRNLVSEKCIFNDISFVVFSILHELGHWLQYKKYIDDGHTDCEFICRYELDRAKLYAEREVEYNSCTNKDDVVALNKKYELLYANLPTEKWANEFAMEHITKYISCLEETHEESFIF